MLTLNATDLARQLIGFDTINPVGNEKQISEFLGGYLEARGFSVRLLPFGNDRYNLVARKGGRSGKLPICFTGHMDTVPLGAMEWRHDPFAGEISHGRLYGRGACDMKSGIAAVTSVAIEVGDQLDSGPGVVLIFTGGEETGCEGAHHLVRDLASVGPVGALVVAEPTGLKPFGGHKGALWLRGVCHGRTAHGSAPHLGENAVYKIARKVTRLEEFNFGNLKDEIFGVPSLNVGTVEGGQNPNSVPDRAAISIDIRSLPGQRHQQIKQQLITQVGEGIDIEIVSDLPSVWTEPDNFWLKSVERIAGEVQGLHFESASAPYFTDASVLTPFFGGVPTVILGPGEISVAHKTDEYCEIRQIEQAVEIYRAIISSWTGKSPE